MKYRALLCAFIDRPLPPRPATFYEELLNGPSGLKEYWQEVSYGRFDLQTDVSGWHVIRGAYAQYVDEEGNHRYMELARDCRAAAFGLDASSYDGFIYFFNAPIRSAAFVPPYREAFIEDLQDAGLYPGVTAHELGHTFGFPHSITLSFGGGASWYDLMGGGWSNPCAEGLCPTVHPIAEHKRRAGWITRGEVFQPKAGERATVVLTPLSEQKVSAGRYRMARIPVRGSLHRYYTVEVRRRDLSEPGLPEEGVLIHSFAPKKGDPRVVFKDAASEGPQTEIWLEGERFSDPRSGIEVTVGRRKTDGAYQVTIDSPAPDKKRVRREIDARLETFTTSAPDGIQVDGVGLRLTVDAPEWAADCYAKVLLNIERRNGKGWKRLAKARTAEDGTAWISVAWDTGQRLRYRVTAPARATRWHHCPETSVIATREGV